MAKKPRGTKDILTPEIEKWHYLEEKIKETAKSFSYKEIRTPMFEHLEVFSRSIGEASDIVNKEMYVFSKGDGKKGSTYALRPEMTAALVRAAIENGVPQANSIERLWYYGPFFRYERPQAGRFRQFHQFGAECLGSPNPIADVEVINLARQLIVNIGIEEYVLLINSLGNRNSQNKYYDVLKEYLNDNINDLSDLSKIRLDKNPLRVLDSKEKEDQSIIENAPKIKDSLDAESQDHIGFVINLLDDLGLNYKIDDNLVRGLDYYSHTVFEFRSNSLGSQDSFGGGGRYNELFNQLGGKDIPAVGFAMGVERILMILDKLNKIPNVEPEIDIYIVKADENANSLIESLLFQLRSKGLRCVRDITSKSVKSQFKDSSRFNSKWTIVIGENEIRTGNITVKNMSNSEQSTISIKDINTFNF
jgi:histidyl-tRNA synthetase